MDYFQCKAPAREKWTISSARLLLVKEGRSSWWTYLCHSLYTRILMHGFLFSVARSCLWAISNRAAKSIIETQTWKRSPSHWSLVPCYWGYHVTWPLSYTHHAPSQASLEPSAWHSPIRRLLQNLVTFSLHFPHFQPTKSQLITLISSVLFEEFWTGPIGCLIKTEEKMTSL